MHHTSNFQNQNLVSNIIFVFFMYYMKKTAVSSRAHSLVSYFQLFIIISNLYCIRKNLF